MRDDIFPDFIKKKQIVGVTKEYLLLIVSAGVNVIQTFWEEFHRYKFYGLIMGNINLLHER